MDKYHREWRIGEAYKEVRILDKFIRDREWLHDRATDLVCVVNELYPYICKSVLCAKISKDLLSTVNWYYIILLKDMSVDCWVSK